MSSEVRIRSFLKGGFGSEEQIFRSSQLSNLRHWSKALNYCLVKSATVAARNQLNWGSSQRPKTNNLAQSPKVQKRRQFTGILQVIAFISIVLRIISIWRGKKSKFLTFSFKLFFWNVRSHWMLNFVQKRTSSYIVK